MTSLRLMTTPILRRAENYYDGRVGIKACACIRFALLDGRAPQQRSKPSRNGEPYVRSDDDSYADCTDASLPLHNP
jgi:hypothetical protein